MSTTASTIFSRAWTLLQDNGTRWPEATLLGWINQGRRLLVRAIPGRFLERRTVQLVAGAVQQVPADCASFIGVWRNRGSAGTTIGKTIRQVERAALDAVSPSWGATTGTEVRDWAMDDPEQPSYLVYPPIPSSPAVWVEIELAAWPADLAAAGNDIGMSDRYATALLYWLLHQAHAAETEEGSAAKAKAYFDAFYAEAKGTI